MNYYIETYGCQMNKAESAALDVLFTERDWIRLTDAEQAADRADLVLINTCSVRTTAETRAWGRIDHYAALKRLRPFTLVVTGCMAERFRDAMQKRQPAIDYVLGTFQKSAFGLVLDAVGSGRKLDVVEESPAFVFAGSHQEPGAFSSFVPIMHGCNNFCTYCIVPYVRGREISRDPQSIVEEVRAAAAYGVREITLLGQNVNSYHWTGTGGDTGFSSLLDLVATEAAGVGIGRLKFESSHPKDLSIETIETMARHPVFARHLHLCVQHGSDRVLAAMNRRYTVAEYRNLVARLQSAIPGITLSTDILVGFPGETEDDVVQTIDLMRETRYAYAFMYYYNPREGTPAAKYADQIPAAEKKARLARIIAVQKQMTRELMLSMTGSEASALVEGVSKRNPREMLARTDQDMMAVFESTPDRIGTFVRLKLTGVKGNTFTAREVT